ncbi:MAG: tRNA lysidine(34) synthetase TilS [Chloroflexi bacterium]|nr:tRNA lysidine(34) synthetase TilS [Chloroflexota bacterium]
MGAVSVLTLRLRTVAASASLFAPGEEWVVGVSGGADSVALLHGLSSLRAEWGISLHVAHLNHRLRGAESDADEAFVADIARSLGLAATVDRADVAALGLVCRVGLEEAGRLARYRFFAEVVHQRGAAGVAVGHTADDQVETLVLHWARGTGLTGLRGMRPRTSMRVSMVGGSVQTLTVVRPLIETARAETQAYCAAVGLVPRVDRTNADLTYRRNRIRLEVIPRLEEVNPRFREVVRRNAQLLALDADFIRDELARRWPSLARVGDEGIVFDLAAWRALPPALQRHALREGVARVRGDLAGLGAAHVEEVVALLHRPATGKALAWPGGLQVSVAHDRFAIGPAACVPPRLPVEPQTLSVPGATPISGTDWQISTRLVDRPCAGPAGDRYHADLDRGAAGLDLAVRRRRPGDRLVPLGMDREKKVQDLLVDAHVPRAARDAVPIVVNARGIVWVAGVRMDDRCRVRPETDAILCLQALTGHELQGS